MKKDDLRREGRRRADKLRDKFEAEGTPLKWFEAIYNQAQGEAALVPWGHLEARFPLLDWIKRQDKTKLKGRALDIGTGLGDNAVVLADAGFDVTAFDISETAMKWAGERWQRDDIDWVVANLNDPPQSWFHAFDFVNETFTLQALKGDDRERGLEMLPNFVKPGGTLLIVARGRLDDEGMDPPPWPLTPSELDRLHKFGLVSQLREEFFDDKEPPRRHFLAEFKRPLT